MGCIVTAFGGKSVVMTSPLGEIVSGFVVLELAVSPFGNGPIAYIGDGNDVPAAMANTSVGRGASSSSIESSQACSSSGDSESGYMRIDIS
jgi:hypothetical protein